MDCRTIARDLVAEQQALDDIVVALDESQWSLPTPSPPWTVIDQIGHLAYFDEAAALAIVDHAAFVESVNVLWTNASALDGGVDELTLEEFQEMASAKLLTRWRAARSSLAAAAATLDDDQRVSWYGPPMGAKSFLTARLMETWAHGQDVVDSIGVERPGSDRLRHIARLGFITRAWSYVNRGLDAPADPVGVALTSPAGEPWLYGPQDTGEIVTGPALDFCLVVTQRRHVDDTALEATPLARDWLLKAQAFAGPPTDGPAPGTRP
jgi:uncharacterized protein (TIGR03084 family)